LLVQKLSALNLSSDGSTSAPGVAFSGDTNTGVYRATTDTMELVAGSYAGIQVKKSTGNYANVGMGGNASVSDNFPLLIERSEAAGVSVQLSNPAGGAAAFSKLIVRADTGAAMGGELAAQTSTSSVDAYTNRIVLRSIDSAAGVSIVAGESVTNTIKHYVGGYSSSEEVLRLNGDKTIQLMQSVSSPTSPSSGLKVYNNADTLTTKDPAVT